MSASSEIRSIYAYAFTLSISCLLVSTGRLKQQLGCFPGFDDHRVMAAIKRAISPRPAALGDLRVLWVTHHVCGWICRQNICLLDLFDPRITELDAVKPRTKRMRRHQFLQPCSFCGVRNTHETRIRRGNPLAVLGQGFEPGAFLADRFGAV